MPQYMATLASHLDKWAYLFVHSPQRESTNIFLSSEKT